MTKLKLKNQEAKELFDDFERFEMFVHERWKWLVTGGVVIVLIVACYGIGTYWYKQMDSKAISALGVAKTEQELVQAIAQYPNHPAAVRARQRLIRMYTDEKKYDEALKAYEDLLVSEISAETRWRCELDMAYVNELKGNTEAAAKAFDRIGSAPVSEDVRSEANYSAGRLYLDLKKDTEADKCLKRVLSSPMTAGTSLWQMQARYLLGKVKTPVPAPTAG